jgi:hypothetical protein
MGSERGRADLAKSVKNDLKSFTNEKRLDHLDAFLTVLGVDTDDQPREMMMSWDDVRNAMPLTTFGGHTHSHPILSQLQPAEAAHEIEVCRQRIHDETKVQPKYFAYPNGRNADFDATTMGILSDLGFVAAYTTIDGCNKRGSDLMSLKRCPTGTNSISRLGWHMLGKLQSA